MANINQIPQIGQILWAVLGSLLFFMAGLITYRLTLHPYASYPGPFLAKLTSFYSVYYAAEGTIHLDIERCHQKYGKVVRYAPNSILVNSADAYHDVHGSTKNLRKSTSYNVHGQGNVIGMQDKDNYARYRRMLSPGFSDSANREHEPKVKKAIESFCEKMKGDTDSEKSSGWTVAKNMALWCNYLTTDIVTDVVFSTSWDLLDSPVNRGVFHSISQRLYRIGIAHQSHWLHSGILNSFVFFNLAKSPITIRDYTMQLITKCITVRANDPDIKDVMSTLLHENNSKQGLKLGLPEINANATTLLIAGSDTSSSALAATFFYLSRHPTAYAKVAQEVRTSFTSSASISAGSTLNSCKYLRASINEAMRLTPVVATPLWRTPEAGGATVDGYFIPTGYNVATTMYSLFHSATTFPTPYKYDIERWIAKDESEEETARLKEMQRAFVPFSLGARVCLAKNFAIQELCLTMANVFWHLDFEKGDGLEGSLGEGGTGADGKEWGRHRSGEFQLKSYFTSHVDGPMVRFRERKDSS